MYAMNVLSVSVMSLTMENFLVSPNGLNSFCCEAHSMCTLGAQWTSMFIETNIRFWGGGVWILNRGEKLLWYFWIIMGKSSILSCKPKGTLNNLFNEWWSAKVNGSTRNCEEVISVEYKLASSPSQRSLNDNDGR